MSPLRKAYLVLTILGAVLPMYWIVRFWQAEGQVSARALFSSWFAGPGPTALAWDLIIASTAFTIWVIAETRVRRNWIALTALPATFLIGLSCGLPLYLFLRTEPIK